MKHWVTYPLLAHPLNPAFVSASGVERIARAAERSGFDAIGFTEHPAPTRRWLESGGHDALDPFAALAFVAAVTERLLLVPNVIVLPYRNPFLAAKSVATLDALSGGRFVLAVAAGYLRGEYRALGVDFDRRNELFDESLAVLRGLWSTEELTFEGIGFDAREVRPSPRPSNVPVWIGGNSALTRRRVAAVGDGWNPTPVTPAMATTARTATLETLADLQPMLDHLWRHVDAAERDPADIDVSFTTGLPGPEEQGFSASAHHDALERMAFHRITWNNVEIPGDSVERAVECLEHYGAEVIAPMTRQNGES